jgi:hypothetical protein
MFNAAGSPRTGAAAMSDIQFKAKLESLPPELYDYIFDLSFAPSIDVCIIDQKYRPPNTLSVDRATRTIMAVRFYGDNSIFHCGNHEDCSKWLISLPPEHRQLLQQARCESLLLSAPECAEYAAKQQRVCVLRELQKHGIEMDYRKLFFRAMSREGEGKICWSNEL